MSPIENLHTTATQFLTAALNNPAAKFRDQQFETIERLVTKSERLLLVQRTGWGKSIVYFIATRLLRLQGKGPTLLISPLLALMRNQIEAANRIQVNAVSINSDNTEEWENIFQQLKRNEIDLLLISPERLANDEFREKYLLNSMQSIGFFVVDEAHCISDWGHDFRPDYRRIQRIVKLLPSNVPVLATTATANNRVVADVVSQLGNISVVRGALRRDTLFLQNIKMPDKASRLAWLSEYVPQLPGSGIIYTLTIRDAEQVTTWLNSRGINVKQYHSKVHRDEDDASIERSTLEQMLLNNEVKALVATTALGMGFDKPDLGFVIHFQRPGSVVHYYQQVGRAGRAIERAYGILFWGEEDDEIADYFLRTAFPPESDIDKVLHALSKEGLSTPELESQLDLTRGRILKIIKHLTVANPQPIRKEGSKWVKNPVTYQVDRDKIDKLVAIRRAEQQRMRDYMENRECLMAFLSNELDDTNTEPCGKCSVCQGKLLFPEKATQLKELILANEFLANFILPIEPRLQLPFKSPLLNDKMKLPKGMANIEGRILCRWGDSGWGQLVKRGKYTEHHFDDQLVQAAAELIKNRWKPPIKWVTCIPSFQHSELVPDFTQRLAVKLGLPYKPAIRKIKSNRPQKEMVNSYHQAQNIYDVFSIDTTQVLPEPVLLIDDMVDSRWTFTIAGLLLINAKVHSVYPFALADTSSLQE